VNTAGLDFYQRLVDLLLETGIQPFVTLHHWDLPAALDDRGGWLNPESAAWFGEYAWVVVRALGDRVQHWVTINEPWVITHDGYVTGMHPPGRPSVSSAPLVAHNLLRAHGTAVQVYRAEARGQIGLVVNLEPKYPASDAPADLAATARADAYMNRQYLDPVFRGSYPAEMPEIFGAAWPRFPAADFALIREPIDFLGVNYYTRGVTRNDDHALPVRAAKVVQPQSLYTEMDWEVWPEALTRVLRWTKDHYGDIPLYVTENGAAFADPPPVAGRVDDPLRVDYLRTHLRAVQDAIACGVDLRGYFAWSLLDNLEWAEGTSKRFGLVQVDFANQLRTPKASADFYRDVIRTRGAALET
ncbi:MAG TPA: family 1 glycosylhydrolase, partial [Candidatus Udaeobacter sp.]|nr:family 1 glycosylhydrolase [Candidatus Udaeobacter sp.]